MAKSRKRSTRKIKSKRRHRSHRRSRKRDGTFTVYRDPVTVTVRRRRKSPPSRQPLKNITNIRISPRRAASPIASPRRRTRRRSRSRSPRVSPLRLRRMRD